MANTALTNKILFHGLRSQIHGIYDRAQTFALGDTLANIEGIDEERREHFAHCAGIHAIGLWLQAVRASGGFTLKDNAAIVDTLTFEDIDTAFSEIG